MYVGIKRSGCGVQAFSRICTSNRYNFLATLGVEATGHACGAVLALERLEYTGGGDPWGEIIGPEV